MGIKQFYKRTLRIAVPIMIQHAITNFVSMLDNIMVGRVGTDSMSGVAIVNQLLFVWYLAVFGGLSGIGIFTAQFYGKKDDKGIRYTYRLMILLMAALVAIGILVFALFGSKLISFYLYEDGGAGSVAATLGFAKKYLGIMLISLLPFAASQIYSTVLRSMGETVAPMVSSLVAVAVNLVGNYVLIYGKFGAPALGVVGAAIATTIARFVEMMVIIVYTHWHSGKYSFIRGALRSFRVPRTLFANCIKKGTPLLLNETLWAGAQALLMQCYSFRGLSVVAGLNISQTVSNVFNVSFIAMGSAIGIIMGQELGMRHMDTVRRDAHRLSIFSILLCVGFGALEFAIAGFFPQVYNTSGDIRTMATGLIRVAAVCMPIYAYENASYFIIRSGGKTLITFIFDSCFALGVTFPVAYVLAHFTGVAILPMFLIVQLLGLIKCAVGFCLVKKGIWIQDITEYGS